MKSNTQVHSHVWIHNKSLYKFDRKHAYGITDHINIIFSLYAYKNDHLKLAERTIWSDELKYILNWMGLH